MKDVIVSDSSVDSRFRRHRVTQSHSQTQSHDSVSVTDSVRESVSGMLSQTYSESRLSQTPHCDCPQSHSPAHSVTPCTELDRIQEIETTNNFNNLNFSGSENVNSQNSDFAPTQHSSPIPPFRPKNRQRNWRSLLLNCRSLVKGKVANILASLNYYQPDCICGTKSWSDKDTTTSEIFPPEYQRLG